MALTPTDLEPLVDSEEFKSLAPDDRGRVLNGALREAHQWVAQNGGWSPDKFEAFGNIATGLRETALKKSTGEQIGGALRTMGGVIRDSAATMATTGASQFVPEKLSDVLGYGMPGFGSQVRDAFMTNLQKAGKSVQSVYSTKDDILDNELSVLKQEIDKGRVPADAQGWSDWLDQRNDRLKQAQTKAYTGMEGDTPENRAFAESNSLLGNPRHGALLLDYLQTRDPAVWDELRKNVQTTPGRAKLEKQQDRLAKDTNLARIMNATFGEGAGNYIIEAGDPLEVAGNLLPMLKGAKAVKALKSGSKLRATGEAVTGAAGETVSEIGSQFVDDPAASWNQRLQVAKDAFIGALGLGGLGAGAQMVSDRFSPNASVTKESGPTADQTVQQAAGAGLSPAAGSPSPSPLGGIARRAGTVDVAPLVPGLEEDTGALTMAEVQDLERGRGGDNRTIRQGDNETIRQGDNQTGRQAILTGVPDRAAMFRDNPLAAPLPASGDVITDLRIPRSPQAIEASRQAEEQRLQKQAELRRTDAKAQGMPLIPDSPTGSRDILDWANENPIYLPPGFSPDRKLPEYDALQRNPLPNYWRQFVASGKRGGNPDEIAQRAFDAGLIAEPSADAYMAALQDGIAGRKQYRVQFQQREKQLAQEEKRVVDFEKSQTKLAKKADTQQVPFEDIIPGDRMTIDGEEAVVRKVDYNEDGYLTNVVIEDGKRFGVMQFDPQNRDGILVDEYQPTPRPEVEEDFGDNETIGQGDNQTGVGQAMSDPFAAVMAGTEGTRPRNRGETDRPQAADPLAELQAANLAGQANQAQGRMDALMLPSRNFTGGLAGNLQQAAASVRQGDNRTGRQSDNQTSGQGDNQTVPLSESPIVSLSSAYAQAARGSSSAMVPISRVYEQAKAQNPALTVPQFLAEVQAADQRGEVLLEPFDSPAGLQAAGEFVVRNASGVPSVNMAVPAPQGMTNEEGRRTNVSSQTAAEVTSTLDNGSPASLFSYDARPENSLDAGERDALQAVRRLPEYRNVRITPVTVSGLARGPQFSPRQRDARGKAVHQFAQAFQRLFNKRVFFIDAPAELNGAVAPGQRNILIVNVNSSNPLLYTLGHELTHSLRRQNPALYDRIAAEVLAQGRDLDTYRARLRAIGYEEDMLNEEIVADFIGAQMIEPDFLNRLAAEKPPLFKWLADAMLRFINGLLSKVKTFNRDVRGHFTENLEALRDQLATALREYSQSGQFPDNSIEPAAGTTLSASVSFGIIPNPLHKQGEPFRVKAQVLRALLTGSPLPRNLTKVLDASDNERRAVDQSAAMVGRDLEAAVKDYAKRSGKPLLDVWAQVEPVMTGQPGALTVLTMLDANLGERARRARNMLDELSIAVSQTMPAGAMKDTILNNLGQWMRRGYAAFDPESGWSYDKVTAAAKAGKLIAGKDAAKILADARNYLRRQNPGATLAEIEADMRDLMDRDTWQSALLGGTVKKAVGSLMQRKDIAPELRALMGEETNPLHRYLQSAKFQAQLVARHHGQQAMKTIGLATGLLKAARGGVYTVEIPKEGHRWSGLGGLWTTPELMKALENSSSIVQDGNSWGGWLVRALKAMGNEAKLNRVALNPDSWLVNVLGGFMGMVQSGDIFATSIVRRLREAGGTIGSTRTKATASALQDAQRDMLARLTEMGVVGSSITLADIEASMPRHLLQWVADNEARDKALGAVQGAIVGQAMGRGLGVTGRTVGGALGAVGGALAGTKRLQKWREAVAEWSMTKPDNLFRVTGWMTNYETALASGMQPDAAAQWASERTLNTFPNYNALPGVLREFSKLGLVGSFIAFQHEVYRNTYWNIRYALQEVGSRNPALQARGLQRIYGLIAIGSLTFGGGLAYMLGMSGAAGADDERNKLFRKWLAAPWERDAVLAFDKFTPESVSYMNTAYLLPQTTMQELAQAAREGAPEGEAVQRVMGRLWEQFAGSSVNLGPIMNALMNQDRNGRRITNRPGVAGALERADSALVTIGEPGFADKMTRIAYAMREAERRGRKFSIEQEVKRLFGLRGYERTWDTLVKGRYSRFAAEYQAIREDANRMIGENLPGAQIKAVEEANARIAELDAQRQQFEYDMTRLNIAPDILKAAKKDSAFSALNPVRLRADGKRVEAATTRR